MNDEVLRKNLTGFLKEGHAHVTLEKAFSGISPANRLKRPKGSAHSLWDLLEHIRIAQEDILRYTLDPSWKSPKWPEGYWPAVRKAIDGRTWSRSLKALLADLGEVVSLVENKRRDLTAEIPHGEGRTYLRQMLLIADHNAYHAGAAVQLRRTLGDWRG